MIPVRITRHIYIRKGPGRQYSSIGDIMPSGKVITMEGIEAGESYKGISDWYYFTNSNSAKQYYWGGGVEPTSNLQLSSGGSSQSPFADHWFNQLGLFDIWSNYGERGANTTILILDSGLNNTVPEIFSALVQPPLNFAGQSATTSCEDSENHGTHCGSLIAARSDTQFIGAAPAAKLLAGKITRDGSLDNADTMKAALTEYAKSNYSVDVISISQELYTNDIELEALISQHIKKNTVVVASIGNDYSFSNKPFKRYPGCSTECISVGSCANDTTISRFSMNPLNTSVFCFGENILSYQASSTPGPLSGTSQSTAIVAGVVALIVSFLKTNGITYDPFSVKNLLRKYSTPLKNNPGLPLIDPRSIFSKLQKFKQDGSKNLQIAIDNDPAAG